MTKQSSRRTFIKSTAAGSLAILGYNPRMGSWITSAQAQTSSFKSVPKLDGVLLLDDASRNAIAGDRGTLFHRAPPAVLRPASLQALANMQKTATQYSPKTEMIGKGQ